MMRAAPPFDLSGPVAAAIERGRPVVALESTILAHGLPRPLNLATGRALEAVIRDNGAEPATIAVLDGRLQIGLTDRDLERVCSAPQMAKLSSADLAVCLANGGSGATTVAATMVAAHAAGIAVFATGGIGGVHPGASESFDVSADLEQLARTPVAVVAAGAKAILDLPATLERLESLAVPVVAVGQNAFPAFWSRDSGLPAPARVDTPAGIAAAIRLHSALGQRGGMLIAQPVPAAAEVPLAELRPLIAQAQTEIVAEGITGKAVTPALLARLAELTGGRTLDANLALVEENARLAAAIATELAGAPMTS